MIYCKTNDKLIDTDKVIIPEDYSKCTQCNNCGMIEDVEELHVFVARPAYAYYDEYEIMCEYPFCGL